MLKIAVSVETPSLPNFVKVGGASVDVADLSDNDLRGLGREWTEALLIHAQRRRDQRAVADAMGEKFGA